MLIPWARNNSTTNMPRCHNNTQATCYNATNRSINCGTICHNCWREYAKKGDGQRWVLKKRRPFDNFLLSPPPPVQKSWEKVWAELAKQLIFSCFLTVCFQLVHLFNFYPLCVFKQNSWYSRSCKRASSSSPLRMQTCRQWMRRKIYWEDEIFEEKTDKYAQNKPSLSNRE